MLIIRHDKPLKIKLRYAITYWTEHAIAITRKQNIPLFVNSSAKIWKLQLKAYVTVNSPLSSFTEQLTV